MHDARSNCFGYACLLYGSADDHTAGEYHKDIPFDGIHRLARGATSEYKHCHGSKHGTLQQRHDFKARQDNHAQHNKAGDDGLDVYVPKFLPIKEYDIEVTFLYKGTEETIREDLSDFINFLYGRNIGSVGGRLAIYNEYTGIGRKDVVVSEVGDEVFDVSDYDPDLDSRGLYFDYPADYGKTDTDRVYLDKDEETGLYYLRSRYYNPEWGRFINADVLIKGNLYCYCSNNPENRFDVSGNEDSNLFGPFPF